MSESPAISLALEWKILWSFLFLYSMTNIVWSLKFFSLLNNSFNLFLIPILVLISCNSGSKKFKISTWQRYMQLSEEFDCTCFSTSSSVFREIWRNLATFLRFCFSFSLEYNFSFADLKYSLKFMATKCFTSSSVKTLK